MNSEMLDTKNYQQATFLDNFGHHRLILKLHPSSDNAAYKKMSD
jgi:hypothetical protein